MTIDDALPAPTCECDRPASNAHAHCVACGRRIASIKCGICSGHVDLEIECRDGVSTVRCDTCRIAGKRPTSARHRRILSIAPMPDLPATASEGER
jgi:hypothetical protein